MKTLALIAFGLLALFATACGDDDSGDGGPPTYTAPATDGATPTGQATDGTGGGDCDANVETPPASGDLSWEAILPDEMPEMGAFTIDDAEGDAPFVNVLRDGEAVGSLELLQFPLDGLLDPAEGFPGLEAWVQSNYESIRADREISAPGSLFEESDTAPVPWGDFCGIAYGFTVASPGGEVTELTTNHATFDGGKLYIIAAFYDAAQPGFGFGSPEVLGEFQDALRALVESLDVPAE